MQYPKVMLKTIGKIDHGEYRKPEDITVFKDREIPIRLYTILRACYWANPAIVAPILSHIKSNSIRVTKSTYNNAPAIKMCVDVVPAPHRRRTWLEITIIKKQDIIMFSLPLAGHSVTPDPEHPHYVSNQYGYFYCHNNTLLMLRNGYDSRLLESVFCEHEYTADIPRTMDFETLFTLACSKNPHVHLHL